MFPCSFRALLRYFSMLTLELLSRGFASRRRCGSSWTSGVGQRSWPRRWWRGPSSRDRSLSILVGDDGLLFSFSLDRRSNIVSVHILLFLTLTLTPPFPSLPLSSSVAAAAGAGPGGGAGALRAGGGRPAAPLAEGARSHGRGRDSGRCARSRGGGTGPAAAAQRHQGFGQQRAVLRGAGPGGAAAAQCWSARSGSGAQCSRSAVLRKSNSTVG